MFCANCGTSIDQATAFCPSCGSRLGAAAPPPPAAAQAAPPPAPPAQAAGAYAQAPAFSPPPPTFPAPVTGYATWGNRALGYIIDSLLVGVGMGILYMLLGGLLAGIAQFGGDNAAGAFCCVMLLTFPLATLLVGIYNRVYLVAQRGYSIGQGVLKVKVVDANGRLLSTGTAFVRLLAQAAMGLVPLLPILDLLWPLWDERRQTLHDKAVGCYVIDNPGA